LEKVLLLTDHGSHSSENSLYALAVALLKHEGVGQVDVASRQTPENQDFFKCKIKSKLFATSIDETFAFDEKEHPLLKNIRQVDPGSYPLVWLRLPPPLSYIELTYFEKRFSQSVVINNPSGIWKTGSKAYLLNFRSVCPPMQICRSLDEIDAFRRQFPIVLKPFREYGGKGIVKIDGDHVSIGSKSFSYSKFAQEIVHENIQYLAVKFLKNVSEGDKRIIVVNGKVLGASLRLPPKGSWICNVAMGGTYHVTEIEEAEYRIIEKIDPMLNKAGIVMYGVDTLVDDNGLRVLSEINTTSIGGLTQVAQFENRPLLQEAVSLILEFVNKEVKIKN